MSGARWTTRARVEFDAYVDYLLDRNRQAAVDAANDLDAAVNLLAAFPDAGRPGRADGTREFSAPRWKKVIVYRPVGGGIEVLSLRDTRMLYKPSR